MALSIVIFSDEADAAGLVKRAISTADTWLVSDIPNLPASKITSGSFPKTMIDSSGTFPWSEISKTGSSIHDIANVTNVGCGVGQVLKVSGTTWQCAADSGLTNAIISINSDTTAAQTIVGVSGNTTTSTSSGTTTINLGSNVVTTGDSAQTITKGLTINSGTLGGDLNANGFTVNNWNVATVTGTTTLTASNEVILVNPSTTAFTITLPDATGNTGKHYRFNYVATTGTVVTIDGDASDTINGRTSITMKYPYSSLDMYSDGTNWFAIYNSDQNYNTENHLVRVDDCTGGIGTSSTVGSTCNQNWTMIETGTGTSLFIDSEVDHLGIKRLATSAANGDDTIIYMGSTATLNVFDSDDTFDLTFIVRPVTSVATVTYMVGANANTAAASLATNENAQFMFSSADPQWQCRTRSVGGTDQTTDSGVTVTADTWYNLRVLKDGGTIRFLINDVNVCNHSTQIPSSALSPFVLVETTTTAARSLDFDYFRGSFVMGNR
jgi:hypothetical protein